MAIPSIRGMIPSSQPSPHEAGKNIIKRIGTNKFAALAYQPLFGPNRLHFFVPSIRKYFTITLAPDGTYRIEKDGWKSNGAKERSVVKVDVKPSQLARTFFDMVEPPESSYNTIQ